VSVGPETWIIPKEAKHPDEAADFYKFMSSLKMAKEFVAKKNTLMSIVGSNQAQLPKDLVAPAKCLRESKAAWDMDYQQWYPSLGKASENAMAALLNGEVTPEECLKQIEKAADEVRKDNSIPKH
jgi:ABC-type glycerol-3-phosphate transport system substrate-binding protein